MHPSSASLEPARRPFLVGVAGVLAVGFAFLGAVLVVLYLGILLGLLPMAAAGTVGPGRLALGGLGVLAFLAAAVGLGTATLLGVVGLKVLQGSGLARLALSALFVFWTVPDAYRAFADIADPAVPLVSWEKMVTVTVLVLLVTGLVGLWTPQAGAWFRRRAVERRLAREVASSVDTAPGPA